VTGPHVNVSSQYKKDNRWPNPQQRQSGFTNHHHHDTGPLVSGARAAQNFPPTFTIVSMKFQLLHRTIKGTPVVSLNTVTRVVHIRLLARQIHNARILPTATASRPARLRRSRVGHLRPRAAVDPAPPTITRTTTSFATEVSLAWTPNVLSLIGHQNRSAIYSCQCGLIMETCLDSSSLIDWLWFWLMDFVAPSLFWINCC
jgi:hypothetical protein